MNQVYSLSQNSVDLIKQRREDRLNNIYHGIPIWESFPRLGNKIPTIEKGTVVLNFASSGIGKSMITRYKDIFIPWLFVHNHPELNIDLRFIIFLLEDDRTRFELYVISFMLNLKFGISL